MLGSLLKFTKIVLLTWVLCPLVLSALAVSSTQAQAVSLKQNAVINTETIKLADIFDDLPRSGDRVLGMAPKPGQEMVLNSRTLLRIALALDLPWRPESSADRVTIKRAASIVGRNEIEAALRKDLDAQGIGKKYKIVFSQGKSEIVLPQDASATVEVSSLDLSADKKTFQATLAAPSKENPLQLVKTSGTLKLLTDVPVLREPLGVGAIIGKSDIEYKEMEADLVGRDAVLKADQLAGMAPRHALQAGESISIKDIEQPRMIERGDVVTMIFREGSLLLTAQGKALENGSKGDQIRVVNASSNKTIDAVVTNSREVTIQSF